jgi:hypothetical protein
MLGVSTKKPVNVKKTALTVDMNAPITTALAPMSELSRSWETEKLICFSCKQMHLNAKVLDVNGEQMGNYSEEYRNHCEAKWVYFKAKNRFQYLANVEKKRGHPAYQKLRNAMLKIHEGNKKNALLPI